MFRESSPISPENYHRPDPLDPAITTLGEVLVEASQMGGLLTPEIAKQKADRFVRELIGGLAQELRHAAEHDTSHPGSQMSRGDQDAPISASLRSMSNVLVNLSEGREGRR